jgi:hypothetical protein
VPLPNSTTKLFENITSGKLGEPPSARDSKYNCIAWAANDTHSKWWPWAYPPQGYWPAGIDRDDTIKAFSEAFATLGYKLCDDASFEPGYEKVAIYVGKDGLVKHMARQLPTGTWTSKLGDLEDIEHETLEMVAGEAYGIPKAFLKRPKSTP